MPAERAASMVAQTPRIHGFVGQQEIGADSGFGHADDLTWGRARERVVSDLFLTSSERSALVRLDVRAHGDSRSHARHGGQVRLERGAIDHQSRSREITDMSR